VYPDYSYPSWKQGKKRRVAALEISTTSKPKKVKVLTHRPKRTETAEEPRLAEGSFVVESSHPATAEARVESAEEPNPKIAAEQPKTLSSLQEAELMKVQKITSITLKRRRMASVLDAVIESVEVLTPASAPAAEGETIKGSTEASTAQAAVEVGPSTPTEARPLGAAEESAKARPSDVAKVPLPSEKEKDTEESEFPSPEASTEELEFMVRHTAGKN
jgi:hypothetical protein